MNLFKRFYQITSFVLWVSLVLLLLSWVIFKQFDSSCYEEIYSTKNSIDGAFKAEIVIGDCGGATTDFFGFVRVKELSSKDDSVRVLTFRGAPEDSNITLNWKGPKALNIYIHNINAIESFNPNNLKRIGINTNLSYSDFQENQ